MSALLVSQEMRLHFPRQIRSFKRNSMCIMPFFLLLITVFGFAFCHTSTYNYDSVPSTQDNSVSQPALSECHLQMECTSPPQPTSRHSKHPSGSNSSRVLQKIRIPIRAARGPQGPPGLRGPAGPRGPPGISSEINEDVVARKQLLLLCSTWI